MYTLFKHETVQHIKRITVGKTPTCLFERCLEEIQKSNEKFELVFSKEELTKTEEPIVIAVTPLPLFTRGDRPLVSIYYEITPFNFFR